LGDIRTGKTGWSGSLSAKSTPFVGARAVIPADRVVTHFGFFCKRELELEKTIRCRCGSGWAHWTIATNWKGNSGIGSRARAMTANEGLFTPGFFYAGHGYTAAKLALIRVSEPVERQLEANAAYEAAQFR